MGKLILGYDLETGASFDVDPSENWITELGAVLWDTETNTPVQMINTLIQTEGREISPEAEQYTGITTEQCNKWGAPLGPVLERFNSLLKNADYVVAHNGRNFDQVVMKTQYQVTGTMSELFDTTPLIDTMTDIPYPANCKNRNLTYLAGFHLILNSFPHRAVTDVLTMLSVLSKYDWNEVETIANSPSVKYIAEFSYPTERKWGREFPQKMEEFNKIKNSVKDLGFKWNPQSKQWVLETKEYLAKDLEFPCPVKEVK
jgi:DNA polymerase-3 subunit epsilon